MYRILSIVAAAVAMTSCAGRVIAPLEIDREFAFEARGELDVARRGQSITEPASPPIDAAEPATGGAASARVRLFELAPSATRALVGETHGAPRVVGVRRESLTAAFRALEARPALSQMLGATIGTWSNSTSTTRRSYVSSFGLEAERGAAIADPRVDTVESGVIVSVKPTGHDGRGALTIALRVTVARVPRPIRRMSAEIAGAPIEIEVPLRFRQTLTAEATVADEVALVVLGLAPRPEGDLVIVIDRGDEAATRPADRP